MKHNYKRYHCNGLEQQHTSTVSQEADPVFPLEDRRWQICPLCLGTGYLSQPPASASSSAIPIEINCHACYGRGIVR